MQDTCIIQAYSATPDTYGDPVPTYTDGAAIACGFDPTGGRESWRPDMTALHVDATVRLPIATTLDTRDRIKITKRFGVAITAIVFEIVGLPQRGPSGLVVELVKVTP